ncbi:MAG TPA: hybrid sensor histidine kinase/response regulator [Nitrospirota bacterium]|nr:hybrid sensor histidine kinase/response regulator [Nitrospirota bacterium]
MTGPLDKSGIIEFFLVEAGEHLQNLNKGLLSLEKNPNDTDMIDELFRAAHTLKGSAAMMGFQGVSDVAHKAEDMLGQFRSGTMPICKETLNFLFDSVDAVKVMVDGVTSNQPEDPLVVESIGRAYKDVVESMVQTASLTSSKEEETFVVSPTPNPAEAEHEQHEDDLDLAWEKTFEGESEKIRTFESLPEEPATSQPATTPPKTSLPPTGVQQPAPSSTTPVVPHGPLRQELEEAKKTGILEKRGTGRRAKDAVDLEKQFIRVNIDRLDNLMNLVGEMIVNRNRLARQVDLIKSLREELDFSQNRLLHEIKKFEEKYEYTLSLESAGPKQEATRQSTDFLELEFDRYDDFNLLSRKLAEITNDTNEIMTELAGFFESFEHDTARISTITTHLQDEITLARMVEMDKLYQMFQRPVRDLAQEENKLVNMVVSGGETKIDKTIFEIISDPLMHMVRNAISHGIETVAERKAAGKDPTGSLIMNAWHEGNSIIIEIEDDGRGMDPAVLRQTAVDKGFMSLAEAQSLTDSESINLIFRPGFSTASKISKVSGRGVGMDVVSTHLARINGRIVIRTEKNVGTKFMIRLPLTLAIAQALIVKLRDQEIAVPMNLVEETTRFSYKDIQRAAGDEMVGLRGTLLRLVKLNELVGMGKFPKKDEAFRHPTLILGMAEKKLALMVEEIIGREEIVVKSLGDYLKNVKLFSGASISGEGNVRLIINIASLFGDESAILTKATVLATSAESVPMPEIAKRKPRVLVVDDSISIRKYVQRFLDRTGYEVEVAPDGMEALNVMSRLKFDAVITDLEMPVMHGYDLIAEMKKSPELMNIPVIVLTSRAGDKHRQKAIEMGAQDYLVKPFEEQEMLEALKKLLSGAALAGRA